MIEEEGARRARLEAIRQAGIDPYPSTAERTHEIHPLVVGFADYLSSGEKVTIVGRVLAIRKHGGMTFLVVEDATDKMQVAIKKDHVGADVYEQFHAQYDRGDFIQVTGAAYETKTKEPTVLADRFVMLTKTLLPLPEKWHGLSDVEIRYRKRYLDLAVNPAVRNTFVLRSNVFRAVRDFLNGDGFMEMNTPILQPLAGGAEARPFITHHNALDMDLYLRIAPELYLKRCLVGGFEKVYEVARCFRNEGISFQHNPEFTQVEVYWAYAGLEDLVQHLQELILAVVTRATGGETTVTHQGDTLDFANIPRAKFYDLVLAETGIDLKEHNTEDSLRAVMQEKGFETEDVIGYGELADEIWKRHVRPKILQPTFVLEYPAAMKPLAKVRPEDPEKSANVQLLVKGMEVLNGWSELNDPLEQERRFLEQEAFRERGSEEAHRVDHDFIEALKIGMPPAAGYGMGLDRICTLLADTHSIKEVILFPTLRPEQGSE